jgi:hypothetical protein
MRRTRAVFLTLGLIGLLVVGQVTAASAGTRAASDPPPSAHLGRLTAEWWQWAIAIPADEHPLNPASSNDCSFAQSGKTWFLGGVVNSGGTVERTCVVPTGTTLLVPALNVECSNVEDVPFLGTTEAEQADCAQDISMVDLDATLSKEDHHGATHVEPLRLTYVVSPQFTFSAPAGNILGTGSAVTGTSVSAGWWTLVHPLPKGEYTLKFGGTFDEFDFTLDVTYHLTVV